MAQIIEVPGMGQVEFPDGMSDDQISAAIRSSMQPQKAAQPAPQRSGFDNIARQVGLTGRYAIEGAGQVGDLLALPASSLLNLGGVNVGTPSRTATALADSLGLPSPESRMERIVGDATRTGFGAAGGAGLAGRAVQALPRLGGTGQAVLRGLADNPAAQIGGGVGSGAAAGAVRENGGGPGAQLLAALAGGVAGGLGGNAALRATSAVAEPLAVAAGASPIPSSSIRQLDDAQLGTVLRNRLSVSGGDWDAIPRNVQASILQDVRKARNLDNLDPQAVQRLADFRTLGVTPTRGTVTLDPIQLTQEKNLAKTAANMRTSNAQGLAQVENANNNRLIQVLQGLEGSREVDPIEAGRALSGSILNRQAALRSAEDAAWEAAKASPAYRTPIQSAVLSDINRELGDTAMMPFMDARISAYMAALQNNPAEFTPQAYRNLQSMLSSALASGGNEAKAAGTARRVLEASSMRPVAGQIPNPDGLPVTAMQGQALRQGDTASGDALRSIDAARRATRAAYAFEDSSPLVRSALADSAQADPARLAQRYILNGTPNEARAVAQAMSPVERQIVRDSLATHIKRRALGGASDEVGNVSQKALNSAINSIGREKLSNFFSPEDIQQLERVGRVASYTQVQPAGSAVNNSNSGALAVGKGIDLLTGISSKVPLLNLDQQIDSLVNLGRTSSALQAGRGIFTQEVPQYGLFSNAGRGAAAGGLLAVPREAPERRKNNKH